MFYSSKFKIKSSLCISKTKYSAIPLILEEFPDPHSESQGIHQSLSWKMHLKRKKERNGGGREGGREVQEEEEEK